MLKQTLKRKQSKIDGKWYWVATTPFGAELWRKFDQWAGAANWLTTVPFYPFLSYQSLDGPRN